MTVLAPAKVIGYTECIAGSMYSGKSTELRRRAKKLRIAGKKVIIFKPLIDNRYSATEVVTHDGESIDCIVVKDAKDMLDYIDSTVDAVGIDETQFFSDDVIPVIFDELNRKFGIRVVCAGLDMYSSGEPFGPMAVIMAKSKYVTKLHAVCVDCGGDAYISHAIESNESTNKESKVKVGSVGEYVALCETCRAKY
ncbi:thymidine kinase [Niallia taxi]|uniref:thymidine kinase n=1 Tax=Niallia taxi TaxID=2499688 RepID=UPI0015F58A2E|nr:thymidine kinase [Niallia taxi]